MLDYTNYTDEELRNKCEELLGKENFYGLGIKREDLQPDGSWKSLSFVFPLDFPVELFEVLIAYLGRSTEFRKYKVIPLFSGEELK